MPRRHPVAILVLPTVVVFDLGVPLQVFGYPRPDLGRRRYDVVTCARRPGRVMTAAGFPIMVSHGLEALARAATIVVPGVEDTAQPIAPEVLEALVRAHRRGARLVSICTGSFVLAAAGLLDGRRATTHWLDAPALAHRFPSVRVDQGVLYVDDDARVLTSAGLAAGIDLCVHVVRRDHGAAVANAVARRMVVPAHRGGGQAQFIPPTRPVVAEGGLEPVREWLVSRLDARPSIPEMAARAGLTPRTFLRRFRAETGMPPLRWVVRQRVLAAQAMLESTELTVEEVARRCGFGSALSLRQHFRREVATNPVAYRRTFRQREAVERSGPLARR